MFARVKRIDERYRQQPAPPQPNPYMPPQQLPYPASTGYTPSVRVGFFRRAMRFMLRRTLYTGARTSRVLRPFRLALGITLPLLAVIALLTTALLWNVIVGPKPVFSQAAAIPPAPAVENFIVGQRTFDGGKMWDSLNSDFQDALANRGLSRESLQEQMQQQKSAGQSVPRAMYIGGAPIKSGGAMYFYLLNGTKSSSFIFTVDAKGKIADIK